MNVSSFNLSSAFSCSAAVLSLNALVVRQVTNAIAAPNAAIAALRIEATNTIRLEACCACAAISAALTVESAAAVVGGFPLASRPIAATKHAVNIPDRKAFLTSVDISCPTQVRTQMRRTRLEYTQTQGK